MEEITITDPGAGKFEERHARLAVIRFRGVPPDTGLVGSQQPPAEPVV